MPPTFITRSWSSAAVPARSVAVWRGSTKSSSRSTQREALAEVRDSYKHRFSSLGYKDFSDYCKTKWGMSRRNAYDLMGTAEVTRNVQEVAQISREEARPLTRLETPEQQRAETSGD